MEDKTRLKAVEVWLKCGANAYGLQGRMVAPAPTAEAGADAEMWTIVRKDFADARKRIDRRRAHLGLPPATDDEFLTEYEAELSRLLHPPPPPPPASGPNVGRTGEALILGALLVILVAAAGPRTPDREPIQAPPTETRVLLTAATDFSSAPCGPDRPPYRVPTTIRRPHSGTLMPGISSPRPPAVVRRDQPAATGGGSRRSSCSSACRRSSCTPPGRRSRGSTTRHGPYLSPFYSPELFGNSPHAWFGPPPSWWPGWLPYSPALLILWAPAGFRVTCYYYRGAYYKAFWADPPACAVGEPRKGYIGESNWPLRIQNIHRYFLYVADPVHRPAGLGRDQGVLVRRTGSASASAAGADA